MIYGAGIDNVDRGQWDAGTALNYSMDACVDPRDPASGGTSDGSSAGQPAHRHVQGIGSVDRDHGDGVDGETRRVANENYRYFEPMTLAGLIYLSISLPAALATKALERRLGSVYNLIRCGFAWLMNPQL